MRRRLFGRTPAKRCAGAGGSKAAGPVLSDGTLVAGAVVNFCNRVASSAGRDAIRLTPAAHAGARRDGANAAGRGSVPLRHADAQVRAEDFSQETTHLPG